MRCLHPLARQKYHPKVLARKIGSMVPFSELHKTCYYLHHPAFFVGAKRQPGSFQFRQSIGIQFQSGGNFLNDFTWRLSKFLYFLHQFHEMLRVVGLGLKHTSTSTMRGGGLGVSIRKKPRNTAAKNPNSQAQSHKSNAYLIRMYQLLKALTLSLSPGKSEGRPQ